MPIVHHNLYLMYRWSSSIQSLVNLIFFVALSVFIFTVVVETRLCVCVCVRVCVCVCGASGPEAE